MAEGEFARVRQHLEAALDHLSDWVGDHDLHALLADAAARQEDLSALERYAPQAEQSAARSSDPLAGAIAHRAFAVAHRLRGQHDRAQARLQQALELFTGLSARWQIGRTHFELGLLAKAQGDAQAAAEQCGRALAEFEGLGAAPDAARIRAALAELGAP